MNPRITKARAHKFKVGTCYMVGVSRIGILECFDVLMFSNIQEWGSLKAWWLKLILLGHIWNTGIENGNGNQFHSHLLIYLDCFLE